MATVVRSRIFVNNQQIGSVSTSTYTYNNGVEQLDTNEGADSFSQGNPRTTMDFDTVIPVTGYETVLSDLVDSQGECKMVNTFGGRVYETAGRLTEESGKSEAKSGSFTGSYKFVGGRRKRVA